MMSNTRSKTQVQRFVETPELMRLFQQERLILQTTERICELMQRKSVTKAALAEKLGTSKAHVTQLLDGRRNMTLRTLADVFYALDEAVDLQAGPLNCTVRPALRLSQSFDWRQQHRQWSTPVKQEDRSSMLRIIGAAA